MTPCAGATERMWLSSFSICTNLKGFRESKGVAIEGGAIAGNARKELEEKLGRSVISPSNASDPPALDESDE